MRRSWLRRSPLLAALLCAICASLGIFAGPAAAASSGTRIISPASGKLVKNGSVKVVVRVAVAARSFRAWLGDKAITGYFEREGRRRVAHLGAGVLKRGSNSLYVTTTGPRVSDSASAGFIVARRDPGLVEMALRTGGRMAPATAKVTHARGSELRANLNGRQIDEAFIHQQGGTRLALLGVPEGVRFGGNRFTVKAIRDGEYDVARGRFRIPRSAHLASAGRERDMVAGTNIELNAAGTLLGGRPGGPRPSYRWRIVDSPASETASATADERSGGALDAERSASPSFQPSEPGTYMIRVRVGGSGGAAGASDTVTVNVRPTDPPIGARLETVADAAGLITIDGKPVTGTGTDSAAISYALLDRTARLAPTFCRSTTAFSGRVARTVAGIKTLEQLVKDCADPRYMLILSSPSGIGEDEAMVDELSSLLKSIGGSALGDESKQGQFSVIGIPTAPEGSAFASFGEYVDPSNRQGRLSGFLQFQSAVNEYGFAFADYPTFDTTPPNVPAGEVGMRIGDQMITDPIPPEASGCNPAAGRATPCAGFHVVAIDRYDLHVRFHGAFGVNTGFDEARDQTSQNSMRIQLGSFGPPDLVFIQSYGNPRATTLVWDDIARQIQRLGGTRTVFDRLDGNGGYSLVGSACQPSDAVECNAGFGGSAAALEASSVLGGTSFLRNGVVSPEPDTARLEGVLARNHDGQFDPALSDPASASTNQLLPVLYGPGEPFPSFTAGEQGANAWITKRLLGSQTITPADLRQQYWLRYDNAEKWTNRRQTLAGLNFPEAAPSCGCSQPEFDRVKKQLDTEIEALVFVHDWIESMQAVLDPTNKTYFDLKTIRDNVQAAVRPPKPDAPAGYDTGKIFDFMFGVGAIAAPEATPFLYLIYAGMKLFSGDDSSVDGAPLLDEIEDKTNDVLQAVGVRYEYARGGLDDMGMIIASDYGKLTTVASNVNAGPWTFPSATTPLRTAVNKGFKSWLYSELLPLKWNVWDLPQIGGANARTYHCITPQHDTFTPFDQSPDSAQYVAVGGMGNGQFPRPEIRDQTAAMGFPPPNPNFADVGEDAHPPPATLIDPVFAPADLDPATNNLGLFAPSYLENDFKHVTARRCQM